MSEPICTASLTLTVPPSDLIRGPLSTDATAALGPRVTPEGGSVCFVSGETLYEPYSTVTDLARFRGWSTSVPMNTAVWYASNCTGMVARIGATNG